MFLLLVVWSQLFFQTDFNRHRCKVIDSILSWSWLEFYYHLFKYIKCHDFESHISWMHFAYIFFWVKVLFRKVYYDFDKSIYYQMVQLVQIIFQQDSCQWSVMIFQFFVRSLWTSLDKSMLVLTYNLCVLTIRYLPNCKANSNVKA